MMNNKMDSQAHVFGDGCWRFDLKPGLVVGPSLWWKSTYGASVDDHDLVLGLNVWKSHESHTIRCVE